MNDPSKRIDVNLSSLHSLKAELLRKHEEVTLAKKTQSANTFVPKKKTVKSTKSEHTDTTKSTKTGDVEEYEDGELLRKSRRILEAKSRFYDRMASNGGSLNSDENCLVLFNQKKQDKKSVGPLQRDEDVQRKRHSDNDDDDDDYDDDEGNWVEYTDCLGRTRKCLKEDLELIKQKDMDLAETVAERAKQNAPPEQPLWTEDRKGDSNLQSNDPIWDDDTESLTSKMSKMEEMRTNWEQKEEENIEKDFVHYQDILFDEARSHGVGYYAFSTDDSERAKQQRELKEIRAKTLTAQKQHEDSRKARDKIIADRVRAAKNRQRARLGLPPIEDEEPPAPEEPLYDNTDELKQKEQQEQLKLAREAEDKRRAEERAKFVRPWDKGKGKTKSNGDADGSDDEEWKYKPQKEPYSQAEWNEIKRKERISEFAPSTKAKAEFRSNPFIKQFDNKGYSLQHSNETNVKKPFKRRPINDFEQSDFDTEASGSSGSGGHRNYGTEIPPPPTFDYYGPSSVKQKCTKERSQVPDWESSISAGLKFLRDQSDKGTMSTKMKWTSNADMNS